ncbi:MAG: DUF3987 domain-containing protein [Candidatus Hydrogenedens sp.]|nr:DUF3987 domain-containing protein [Candidatus Hydrogenedens sp.]
MGLVAVTSKGGAKSAHHSDWATLAPFKKLVMLPDNDEAGEGYFNEVLCQLASLEGSRGLIVCYLPDVKDVSDFIEAGHSLADLEAAIKEHGEVVTLADIQDANRPEHVQLFQPPPEREPFPTDALGPELAGTVKQIAHCIGVTEAMTAQSILAGLSLVVQAHANVKIGSIEKPTSLYCLTIAESGSRKTTLDNFVLRPHREWEARKLLLYEEEMADYKHELRAYKKLADKATSGANKTREEIVDRLKELGREPEKPLAPYLIISNATTEALHYRLSEEMPYCGLFTSEGGTFIGGYSMNSDNVISTIAHFSELWDGAGGIRLRVEKGSSNTRGRRFAAHMMVQPDVAGDLVESELIQNQGFLARMLLIEDESLRGRRTVIDEDITTKPEYQQYCRRMEKLLDGPPKTNDRGDELKVGTITASREAAALWWAYQQNIEQQLSPNGTLETIYPWANKAAEHGLRIAGNLAIYGDKENLFTERHGDDIPLTISEEVMARALCIADYYLKENLRFYESAKISELQQDAQKLLEFLHQKKAEKKGSFTRSYIRQYGPYALRKDSERIRAALGFLKGEGCVSVARNEIKLF